MKLSNIKYIMIAMLITFASCSKEENVPAVSVEDCGDFVNIGSLCTNADDSYKESDTKIKYGNLDPTAKKWELKWDAGDKVKITRHGTATQSVNYIVTPTTSDPKIGTLAVESGKEEDKLRWSTGGSSDIFSIAYPADAVVGTPSNNEVELQYDMNIAITAVKGSEPTATDDFTKTNFRMLNFQSVNKTGDNVNLTSVPATTTLDITIKNTTSEMLSVARVAISITNTKGYISKDGKVKFKYNSVDKTVSYIPYSDAPSVVSFVVTINNSSGYIDLNSGENIKFKVFIPGIPYKQGDYKLRVNYGTSGKLYTPTIDLKENVKHPLIINAKPGDDSGWIVDLPDDMKVLKMSIPGSYYCNSYLYTNKTIQPKVQYKDIIGQWKLGVRVFETPCDYSGSSIYSSCRGSLGYQMNNELLTDVLFDKLILMLKKESREFAIVINRYNRKNNNYFNKFKEVYDSHLQNYINNNRDYFYLGQFDNNIKIEDLRGKILLIHESTSSSIGPVLSNWIDYDKQGTTPFTDFTIGNQPSSIVSIDEADRKSFTVSQRQDLANKNFANASKGTSWTITDLAMHDPNRNNGGYITGATYGMKDLIATTKGANDIGIILLPFLGDRYLEGSNSGGSEREVFGDVLTQIIINKNFK